jgi:hypothetical protein
LILLTSRVQTGDGKGGKDRVTLLPQSLVEPLQFHLQRVKALHEQDLRKGFGRVEMPSALVKKYSQAELEWCWQYVFPSYKQSHDPRSDVRLILPDH